MRRQLDIKEMHLYFTQVFPNVDVFVLHINLKKTTHFFCTDHDDPINSGKNLARLWFGAKKKKILSVTVSSKVDISIMIYHFYSIEEVCLFSSNPSLKIIRATNISKVLQVSLPRKTQLGRKGLVITHSTDGVPLRLGNTHGFAALVKKGAPHKTMTH